MNWNRTSVKKTLLGIVAQVRRKCPPGCAILIGYPAEHDMLVRRCFVEAVVRGGANVTAIFTAGRPICCGAVVHNADGAGALADVTGVFHDTRHHV